MSIEPSPCQHELPDLRQFLHVLCRIEGREGIVYRLAKEAARWSAVEHFIGETEKAELREIAFRPRVPGDGFSPCNLKAHYVLDEDFINNGSAIVLFSLVGARWTHVEYVSNQNAFTTAEMWLDGDLL